MEADGMTSEKPTATHARAAGMTFHWGVEDGRLHYWAEGQEYPLCLEAGADVPGSYWGVRDRSHVTCQDCLEWIHG
jgi:hypothetical protein